MSCKKYVSVIKFESLKHKQIEVNETEEEPQHTASFKKHALIIVHTIIKKPSKYSFDFTGN